MSATHSAILRSVCGDREYLACNAPLRLELPDGRMAWLRQGVRGTTCAQFPVDTVLSTFPAAEVVWKRGTVGEGTRQIDNVAAIQTALNAHNAATAPTTRADDGGCGCAFANRRAAPALGIAGAALAIAAVAGRRRRRR